MDELTERLIGVYAARNPEAMPSPKVVQAVIPAIRRADHIGIVSIPASEDEAGERFVVGLTDWVSVCGNIYRVGFCPELGVFAYSFWYSNC